MKREQDALHAEFVRRLHDGAPTVPITAAMRQRYLLLRASNTAQEAAEAVFREAERRRKAG